MIDNEWIEQATEQDFIKDNIWCPEKHQCNERCPAYHYDVSTEDAYVIHMRWLTDEYYGWTSFVKKES